MIRSSLTIIILLSGVSTLSLPHFSIKDRQNFATIFRNAIKNPNSDAGSLHHSVAGLNLLGEAISDGDKQSICVSSKSKVEEDDILSLYHGATLAKELGSVCTLDKDMAKIGSTIEKVIAGQSITTQNLYYAAAAADRLGIKVDSKKLDASLTAAIKKDDGAQSLGYSFHAARFLDSSTDLKKYFERIEDLVAQADEVDNQYLQFEGGLSLTAMAVSGIYYLAEKHKKTPVIKDAEILKFTNYMLNRKGVQLIRPAYLLLRALKQLTDNKYHIPVCFWLTGNSVISTKNSVIKIGIGNVMGEPISETGVTIDSATHIASSGVVLSKKAMAKSKGEYEFDFMSIKPIRGFYKLSVTAGTEDKRLVGRQGFEMRVKVTTEVGITGAELLLFDREHEPSSGQTQKLQFPEKSKHEFVADNHQKLNLKFKIVDNRDEGKTIKVHQAFVVFVHDQTKREIVFVAEPDKQTSVYAFDADFQTAAKDFDNLSGHYSMNLIIGDAMVENPINWLMTDIDLKFPEQEKVKKESVFDVTYEKKPKIEHTFRKPDPRPPQSLSDLFTAICLSPLLILAILWLKLGVNASNFSFSLSAIVFHLSFGAILALFFLFWLQLNMFNTLKILAGLAGVAFLSGNRMLKHINERREEAAKSGN